MPRDVIDTTADVIAEMVRLNEENAQLRALVSTLCGEIQKIAAELGRLIDKDNR
jgi:hypothetical protein